MKISLHSGLNFSCVTSSPPVCKYFQCEIPCLSVRWLRSQSLFVTLDGCLDFSVVIDDTALVFCRIGSYISLFTWGPLPSFSECTHSGNQSSRVIIYYSQSVSSYSTSWHTEKVYYFLKFWLIFFPSIFAVYSLLLSVFLTYQGLIIILTY